jgi:hypothetical protein
MKVYVLDRELLFYISAFMRLPERNLEVKPTDIPNCPKERISTITWFRIAGTYNKG